MTDLGYGLHHVQLALPPGGEDACRASYVGVLGLTEVAKPPRKAHPGILVTELDALAERLTRDGSPVTWDDVFPEMRRFYSEDPFGNRLAFLSPRA